MFDADSDVETVKPRWVACYQHIAGGSIYRKYRDISPLLMLSVNIYWHHIIWAL